MVLAVTAKGCGQKAVLGQVDCSACANLSSLLLLLLLLQSHLCLLFEFCIGGGNGALVCVSWLQALLVLALAETL